MTRLLVLVVLDVVDVRTLFLVNKCVLQQVQCMQKGGLLKLGKHVSILQIQARS